MASDIGEDEDYFKSEKDSEEEILKDNDQLVDFCVLCCLKVKVYKRIIDKTEDVDLVFNNLTVIFLLKKVLQLPDSQLESNLKECGNPDNWIVLCDDCTDLSRKAKILHSHIVKTARQLRITEQLILTKVKSSLSLKNECQSQRHEDNRSENDGKSRKNIWRNTRDFITTHDYSNQSSFINPFIEGDKLAEKLSKRKQSSVHFLKAEVDSIDLDDNDDCDTDAKWETPTEEVDVVADKYSDLDEDRKSFSLDDNSSERDDHDDDDTIWEEAEEKLDTNLKLEKPESSAPTTLLSNQSVSLSKRRKTKNKKLSVVKTKDPPTKPRLKRNQTAHVKIYGKFKCNFCDKLFSSGSACYTHEREKHADNPGQFSCDLCPKLYNSWRLLDIHKRQTHKIKPDGTPNLWKPKKSYRRIPTICSICGKNVTHLQLHHRYVHEKRVEDFCHVCGKGFKNATNWRKHLLSVHPDDPVTLEMKGEGVNIWRCEVKGCNGNFLHKTSLEGHVEKIHGNNVEGGKGGGGSEEKRFVCETCGKGFWRKDKLKRHELIHNKQKK